MLSRPLKSIFVPGFGFATPHSSFCIQVSGASLVLCVYIDAIVWGVDKRILCDIQPIDRQTPKSLAQPLILCFWPSPFFLPSLFSPKNVLQLGFSLRSQSCIPPFRTPKPTMGTGSSWDIWGLWCICTWAMLTVLPSPVFTNICWKPGEKSYPRTILRPNQKPKNHHECNFQRSTRAQIMNNKYAHDKTRQAQTKKTRLFKKAS